MALDSVDKLIAGLAGASQRIPILVGQSSVSTGNNSKWRIGGYPTAAATPPSQPTGEVPTKDTPGAVPFTNAAAGKQLYLAGIRAMQPQNFSLLLVDRLWHCSGIPVTSSTTNLSMPTSPARGADPYECEFGTEVSTAFTGANTTMTFQVIDGDGNPQTMVTNGGLGTGNPLNSWGFQSAGMNTGIKGVKQVTQTSIGSGYTAGVMGIVHYRRIAYITSMGGNLGYSSHDGCLDSGLLPIPNDACLSFVSFGAAGTSEGPLHMELELIEV